MSEAPDSARLQTRLALHVRLYIATDDLQAERHARTLPIARPASALLSLLHSLNDSVFLATSPPGDRILPHEI
ncbi:hypothetical protein E2C01_036780 [Portunus trituberculatus]|uniref:Uncharacterized protein n=1 Tax=Portunus trituberculatus TaxID=210409 RepID=A0A5B7FDD9_PORTR|nr:hypothetical protein [Portunus trituberculatus]